MLLKVLTKQGGAIYTDFRWPLPENGKAGDWLPSLPGKAIPCEYGYHFATENSLFRWFTESSQRIFIAELRRRNSTLVLHNAHSEVEKLVTTKACRLVAEVTPTQYERLLLAHAALERYYRRLLMVYGKFYRHDVVLSLLEVLSSFISGDLSREKLKKEQLPRLYFEAIRTIGNMDLGHLFSSSANIIESLIGYRGEEGRYIPPNPNYLIYIFRELSTDFTYTFTSSRRRRNVRQDRFSLFKKIVIDPRLRGEAPLTRRI